MAPELVRFAASLAAVLALVGLAHLLGFSTARRLESEADAREQFRLAPGGFEPRDIVLDKDGGTALASDGNRALMILVPHGRRHVALKVGNVTLKEEALEVATAPPDSRHFILHPDGDPPDWVPHASDAS